MKICLLCQHFRFDGGRPAWSDTVGAEHAEMSCFKGMWCTDIHNGGYSARELRARLLTAERCNYYEQVNP